MIQSLEAISEAAFQNTVRELAELCGWKVLTTWKSIHSPKGTPDLWLIRPPQFIAAELKTTLPANQGPMSPKGQPTIEQAEVLELLSECPGVEPYLWRPEDWDEIVEVLS